LEEDFASITIFFTHSKIFVKNVKDSPYPLVFWKWWENLQCHRWYLWGLRALQGHVENPFFCPNSCSIYFCLCILL